MVTLDAHRVVDRIVDGGVIAVMRGADPDRAVETAEALRAGGVTAVEITAESPDAMATLAAVADALDGEDCVVGAGTVLDAETARRSIAEGAAFVVSPTVEADVIETANRYGVPVAPGAFTPTEVLDAYERGADLVKVFPAATGGPGHLRSLAGPLPQVPLVPTGGVDLDNVRAFVAAGAVAVGAGSALVDDEAVAAGKFDRVTDRARAFTDAVAEAREN